MRQRFDLEFQALLDRDNPDTRSIWCFVERTLRQYRLDVFGVTADEVLSEVYARGIRQIVERKKGIENPLGWIRLTANYVILEHSRRARRSVSLESVGDTEAGLTVASEMEILINQEEIEANIQSLYWALNQLTPREQEILCWRHMDALSWQEVGKRLIDCGEAEMTEAALRQRGYRVLMRLRKLFHSCRTQDPGDQAA
jgi:RNA polymerase sigma factor (sigma-70 family)